MKSKRADIRLFQMSVRTEQFKPIYSAAPQSIFYQ